MAKKRIVTTTINGQETQFLCEPRQTLLEVLRDELDLTGAKEGCNNGNCGACTVLLNGRAVDSCLVLAVELEDAVLDTIEGVASTDGLDEIQQAFLENAALQCGICTPGFIMSAKALLDKNRHPPKRISDSTLPVTCVGVLAMTKLYEPSRTRLQQKQKVRVRFKYKYKRSPGLPIDIFQRS